MAFETPITIAAAIRKIRANSLLLPAIQREFVWDASKITWLFDSILQGYPFGSFLFWEVGLEAANIYRFYGFISEYREFYKTHNPDFSTQGHCGFQAVLDGQQRLTSLYLGLTGSYAWKRPYKRWADDEQSIPTRQLYLNLLNEAPSDEETRARYDFRFLTSAEVTPDWFRVGEILTLEPLGSLVEELKSPRYSNLPLANNALSSLHHVIFTQPLINYYNVREADLDRALNVFVRVNSGSEPLRMSDILMSTAIANWTTRNAKKDIYGLVDNIRAKGFFIDKDLVLKTCLYLYSSDIGFKARNFTTAQVALFETHWEAIDLSVRTVFDLARDFGYNETALRSKNALLPIIYYVHHRKIAADVRERAGFKAERDVLRRWLNLVLLKRVFGVSSDTVLTKLRKAFVVDFGNSYITSDIKDFPAVALARLAEIDSTATLTDEFIESLLHTQYGERDAFTILAILAPHIDYSRGDFHKDHMHPESMFTEKRLAEAGIAPSEHSFFLNTRHYNSILNLRHLDGPENKSKQDKSLIEWVALEAERQHVSCEKFCVDHDLPVLQSTLELSKFRDFISWRKEHLAKRLREVLQGTTALEKRESPAEELALEAGMQITDGA